MTQLSSNEIHKNLFSFFSKFQFFQGQKINFREFQGHFSKKNCQKINCVNFKYEMLRPGVCNYSSVARLLYYIIVRQDPRKVFFRFSRLNFYGPFTELN